MSSSGEAVALEPIHHPVDAVSLGYRRKVCRSCGTDWPCPDGVKERCASQMAEGQEWCDCGQHTQQDGGDS
jgi:hypothetical protein